MNPDSLYQRNKDALVYSSDTPDISELCYEFSRSVNGGVSTTALADVDDIRYNRWVGQSRDSKKWSKNLGEGKIAYPFEGASDVKVLMADETINTIKETLMNAFYRCKISVTPTEASAKDEAATVSTLMEWLVNNRLRSQLSKEAELIADYALNYGWAVGHVIWEQKTSTRYQVIRMEEIVQIVQQALQQNPQASIKDLPEAIMNPEMADYATDLISQYIVGVKRKEVKKAVKQLREEGEARIPEVYVSKNQPTIIALKPYEDISFPPETISLQDARVIFRRCFMTEREIRANAAVLEWNNDWVEAAVNTAGKETFYTDYSQRVTDKLQRMSDRKANLIEVCYAYSKSLDEDGMEGVYQTVFCPQVKNSDLYASHELLGYAHGKYPFVLYRRENNERRVVECRGVTEIAESEQIQVKAQLDSLRDRTSLTTMPPLLVKARRLGFNNIGPAVQVPVTSPDDMRWMPPPSGDANLPFQIIQNAEIKHCSYFGIPHPSVHPQRTQNTQQAVINNWLSFWREVFSDVMSLELQFATPEEIDTITGGRQVRQNASSISNNYEITANFDARDLDNEWVIKKMQAYNQAILPADRSGVVNTDELLKGWINQIDPSNANVVIVDKATASQKLYKDAKSDIGLMMLGIEADYVENDPTAESKLQYIQDLLGKNPVAQAQMQKDPHFRALLDNYVKNLQMSVMQQRNKQIGRTGVTPVAQQASQNIQGALKQAEEAQNQAEQEQQVQ